MFKLRTGTIVGGAKLVGYLKIIARHIRKQLNEICTFGAKPLYIQSFKPQSNTIVRPWQE
jgi:hypothetical protein